MSKHCAPPAQDILNQFSALGKTIDKNLISKILQASEKEACFSAALLYLDCVSCFV